MYKDTSFFFVKIALKKFSKVSQECIFVSII